MSCERKQLFCQVLYWLVFTTPNYIVAMLDGVKLQLFFENFTYYLISFKYYFISVKFILLLVIDLMYMIFLDCLGEVTGRASSW